MSLETNIAEIILPLGFNKNFLPQLIEQIKSPVGIIPFVGAGLSVPFHLPNWDDFLLSLTPDDKTREAVTVLLKAKEYEKAAEHLYELLGAEIFQTVFSQTFTAVVKIPEPNAVSSLMRFPAGPIITTNFDRVIETVFDKDGCRLNVVEGVSRDKVREAFQFNTNSLLKIHGDAGDRSERVLTYTEYEKKYSDSLRTLLLNVSTRSLLFLGSSLYNDRPVQVLKEVTKEGRSVTKHFALLAMPAPEELLQRTRQLTDELNIYPIYYPAGEFKWIKDILDHLGNQVKKENQRNYQAIKKPLHRGVPASPFQLFGRDKELANLLKTIKDSQVVVVEGSRGVGKTALVFHAFRQLLTGDSFGALAWLSAAARKEQLRLGNIIDEISLTLDYPFTPQTSEAEKEQILLKELEQRNFRCLLLLDNYETITDPDIDDFLFKRLPPSIHVLLTTTSRVVYRQPLQPALLHTATGVVETGNTQAINFITLEELDKPDALLLFRERLTRDGLQEETVNELERLFNAVGGNPLALEWIVGQMRQGKEMPFILDLMQQGKADILPAVFEQSWKALHEGAQKILGSMAVFVTPPLKHALQQVTGLSDEVFEQEKEQLARMYLIKRFRLQQDTGTLNSNEPVRYFMHPFTRDFIQSRRNEKETAVNYARAAAYYLDFADKRGGSPDRENKAGHAELNAERLNILAILHGCLKNGQTGLLIQLTETIARWLFIESHWEDLEYWATLAIENAKPNEQRKAKGRILNELGRVYSYRSQFKKAEDVFKEALQDAALATPPDEYTIAYIKHHAGEAKLRQKNFEEARGLLADSLAQFEKLGCIREAIGVRYRLAVLAFETGAADAQQRLQQGVDDTINEDWGRLEGLHRRYLGDLAVKNKDTITARYQYNLTLQLVNESDMRIQAQVELSLAYLEEKDGKIAEALYKATQARDHFKKLGMRKEQDEAGLLVFKLEKTS